MLLGSIRGEMHQHSRPSRSAPPLTPLFSATGASCLPSSSPSTMIRTPMSAQQAMNYARMSYRYTTVTLLSLRPQPEITLFPDHLVDRRFLDEENFIDLDRMLAEMGGKFSLESFGMREGAGDGPLMMASRVHKYDFSDPGVIEKVKNRRPKDPLTPHQVAALTSVVTRHQPSTFPPSLLSPHQNHQPSSNVWIDDYSRRQAHFQRDSHHCHPPPAPSMPYHRQNPNQYETYSNTSIPLVSAYQQPVEQRNIEANVVPILQRLVEAQQRQRQQQQQFKINTSPLQINDVPHRFSSTQGHHHSGLSAFCTPASPQHSNTFGWPFSTGQTQKSGTHPLHVTMATHTTVKQNQDVLAQLINDHLQSAAMETPITPTVGGLNVSRESNEEEEEQSFYSAPPSPTQQRKQDSPPSSVDVSATASGDNLKSIDHARLYNQSVLLNTFVRNMVNEQQQRANHSAKEAMSTSNVSGIRGSPSDESCFSNDTLSISDSHCWNLHQLMQNGGTDDEQSESYTEVSNLVRLLSPGVKTVAQQEMLQYLQQGCEAEREEMLRLTGSLNAAEQSSLKPILLRLILEQVEVMKKQQDMQQGKSLPTPPQQTRSMTSHYETRSPLESWFGSDIYTNAYPRMPRAQPNRVISACDLEQSRLAQRNDVHF